MRHWIAICAFVTLTGCALETGADELALPVIAGGSEARETLILESADGWSLDIEEARVAFGALYLCASEMAGDFCEVARGEMLETIVIDGLAAPEEVATLFVESADVRSLMFDLGIRHELRETDPVTLSPLPEGASVLLRGNASREDRVEPFEFAFRIEPLQAGTTTVRRSMETHTPAATDQLLVELNLANLVREMRFSPYLEAGTLEDTQTLRALRLAIMAQRAIEISWNEPSQE